MHRHYDGIPQEGFPSVRKRQRLKKGWEHQLMPRKRRKISLFQEQKNLIRKVGKVHMERQSSGEMVKSVIIKFYLDRWHFTKEIVFKY